MSSLMSSRADGSPYSALVCSRCVSIAVALVAAGLGVALAGCANPGYDRADTRRELRESGLTDEQAQCIARGLERRVGIRALNSHRSPTETELERAVEVFQDCGVDVTDAAGSS
jgi:hypothetical protein